MPLTGEYLGRPVAINDLDTANQAFYRHCASGALHLQHCPACDLLRYPTTTACPWCAGPDYGWKPVSGKGTLYSYTEVHHAIDPGFRPFTPYLILLVELDEQAGQPTAHEALRVNGNLAGPGGELASAALVRTVGIGSRLKVVFKDMGGDIALPLWTLDDEAEQPAEPWRYPGE
ncbi:MAG: hypothetical protein F4X31_03030 [Gammaproteobacteria bacterium]|nr:hypothetical protein [Gammaproteobacteria bacterium]